LNDRVLFKDQSTTFQNGIYYVSNAGSGGTSAVYTRTLDFDQPSEIDPGDLVPVLAGSTLAGTLWLQTATVTSIGTSPITFIQFAAAYNNVVTLTGTQTITGAKTFSALTAFADITATRFNNLDIIEPATYAQLIVADNKYLSVGNSVYFFGTDTSSVDFGNGGKIIYEDAPTIMGYWNPYTPTFTGFGTVTNVQIWSRRVGESLEVRGRFQAGTTTATEARMTLGFNGVDGNVVSSNGSISSIQLCGHYATGAPAAANFAVLIEANVGYCTFSLQNAGRDGLTKADGNIAVAANTVMSLCFSVPIAGFP
jgi:hypothetical protein